MHFVSKTKGNNPVEAWNLDQAVRWSLNEKTKVLTVDFSDGSKADFKDKDAEILYALLSNLCPMSLSVAPYDWQAEIKKDQAKARKEAAEVAARTGADGRVAPKSPTASSTGL